MSMKFQFENSHISISSMSYNSKLTPFHGINGIVTKQTINDLKWYKTRGQMIYQSVIQM